MCRRPDSQSYARCRLLAHVVSVDGVSQEKSAAGREASQIQTSGSRRLAQNHEPAVSRPSGRNADHWGDAKNFRRAGEMEFSGPTGLFRLTNMPNTAIRGTVKENIHGANISSSDVDEERW